MGILTALLGVTAGRTWRIVAWGQELADTGFCKKMDVISWEVEAEASS